MRRKLELGCYPKTSGVCSWPVSLDGMDRSYHRKQRKGFEDNEVFLTTSRKEANLLVKRSLNKEIYSKIQRWEIIQKNTGKQPEATFYAQAQATTETAIGPQLVVYNTPKIRLRNSSTEAGQQPETTDVSAAYIWKL